MKTSIAVVTDIWGKPFTVIVVYDENRTSFSQAISELPFKVKSVDSLEPVVTPKAFIVSV